MAGLKAAMMATSGRSRILTLSWGDEWKCVSILSVQIGAQGVGDMGKRVLTVASMWRKEKMENRARAKNT